MPINSGRSICIHCQRILEWYENIPLLSFIILQGKCRICRKFIPWHYPCVEAVTMISFIMASWYTFQNHFSPLHLLRDLIFIFILISIFVTDGLYSSIPIPVVLVGILIGFIINHFFLSYSLGSLLLAAGVAGGFFLLQFSISRGRWIGSGDVWIGFMIGVWLGWPIVLIALFLSYVVGAAIGIALLVGKRKKINDSIPFGTFLALGTGASLYIGRALVDWYMSFLK